MGGGQLRRRRGAWTAPHSTSRVGYPKRDRQSGAERAIHFPFNRVAGLPKNKLKMFLRSDRIAQFGVRYFMGMKGYTFEKYLALIDRYSEQHPGEPEGAVIIFADDAEYVGTNGWFRLKYENKPDNTFEHTPESREKLIALVKACRRRGTFCTFDEACRLPPNPEAIHFDDDTAWHGGRASTWAQTPMAELLRPWQDLVRDKLLRSRLRGDRLRRAWFHLTNSYNSDGQWPPTLPDAPHIIHPFNYAYCFDNLLQAELLVGGVDRRRLKPNALATLRRILGPQQKLILAKAKKQHHQLAGALIETSQNLDSARSSPAVLQPSEYGVRADALVAARRLVGGVEIEAVQDLKAPRGRTAKR